MRPSKKNPYNITGWRKIGYMNWSKILWKKLRMIYKLYHLTATQKSLLEVYLKNGNNLPFNFTLNWGHPEVKELIDYGILNEKRTIK